MLVRPYSHTVRWKKNQNAKKKQKKNRLKYFKKIIALRKLHISLKNMPSHVQNFFWVKRTIKIIFRKKLLFSFFSTFFWSQVQIENFLTNNFPNITKIGQHTQNCMKNQKKITFAHFFISKIFRICWFCTDNHS